MIKYLKLKENKEDKKSLSDYKELIKKDIDDSLCLLIIGIILFIIGLIFIPIGTVTIKKESYFNYLSLEAFIVYLGIGIGFILLITSLIILFINLKKKKEIDKKIEGLSN